MNIIEEARRIRKIMELAATSLPDDKALEAPELFPKWAVGISYKIGDRVRYTDLYKVVQAHTSQADWTPDKTPALYVKVADPAIEWPEWVQPTGAHDAYNKGDKVSYQEKHWISDIDANVYAPGVYGWTEQ